MVAANSLSPGLVITIGKKMYRIESSIKVTVPKGTPFIKAKLRELDSDKVLEKNFQPDQQLQEVSFEEQPLEFLYPEGKGYLFLNSHNFDQVFVPADIISDKVNFLKEGVQMTASFSGEMVYSIELPQFLELMVSDTEGEEEALVNGTKTAILETGAKVKVPPFIEVGDIIKVDTKTAEYIQRV
jgi:elongation factor P